ncbi:ABC-2 type transport system ATP-binding protein/lipopolysaccharide export system ATP-binding protein [Oribacterium sp. KHPX15]|uniref:ABC transporter ATP-binding protein n=1 Tax=unclassified Oribacterium TaxID=2629782 RepID=UPI0005D1E7FD|nr:MULTISPECIES: ABC transporter ATP-binding protein [unclassified Oribacterium]SEA07540.1 ABC-2 type transport system ATP-binding protein/lipopolysaccharide export system ATP-binding protein [Oribacterium sp. KHPX15]
MIEANGLVKKYGNFTAVDNASLLLEKGEVIALLGSNGSGKSTLLGMLAMVLKPDSGEVTVDGLKGKQAKEKVAYVPQEIVLFEELTVVENLYAWSSLKGKENEERAGYLINELGMTDFKKKRVDRLSGGQRRRVNLAVSLMGKYDYLLLDEPLAGIDAHGGECIEHLLRKEKEKGCAMILTEHNPTILLPLTDRSLRIEKGHLSV